MRHLRILYLLVTVVPFAGCESIALMPRPTLDELERRGDIDRRPIERARETPMESARIETPRPRAADEITGTVQKLDQSRREIHLRTTDAKMIIIKYDPATMVYNRDREMAVESLRYGDLILVKIMKNNRGEQHADLIRISS